MNASPSGRPGWRHRLVDLYLRGWAAGALVASLGLLLRREDIASGSQWPESSWQREIGLWNLILITLIAQVLKGGSRTTKLAVVRTGIVASILLGGNHLITLLGAESGPVRLHGLALVGNTANLAVATAVLLLERRVTAVAAGSEAPNSPSNRA